MTSKVFVACRFVNNSPIKVNSLTVKISRAAESGDSIDQITHTGQHQKHPEEFRQEIRPEY